MQKLLYKWFVTICSCDTTKEGLNWSTAVASRVCLLHTVVSSSSIWQQNHHNHKGGFKTQLCFTCPPVSTSPLISMEYLLCTPAKQQMSAANSTYIHTYLDYFILKGNSMSSWNLEIDYTLLWQSTGCLNSKMTSKHGTLVEKKKKDITEIVKTRWAIFQCSGFWMLQGERQNTVGVTSSRVSKE